MFVNKERIANPQGQFLFLEGIVGSPFIKRFADFLISKGKSSKRTGKRAQLAF
jgi:hypothetical protein